MYRRSVRRNGTNPGKDGVKFRLNLSVLLFLLLLSGIGFFTVIRIFIIPIVLAVTLTILFYPLFRRLIALMRGHRNLAALFTCIITLLIILIPLYAVVFLVAVQLIGLIGSVDMDSLQEFIQEGTGLLRNFQSSRLGRLAAIDQEEIVNAVKNLLAGSGALIGRFVNRMSSSLFEIVTTLFITLFSMFYFFRDGEKIVDSVLYLSPLRPEYEENIMNRFVLISRATIQGTLMIGLIQGGLGAILLLATGVSTWLLWGIVMIILAVIPVLGPWLVLLPIGIIMLFTGEVVRGIIVLAVSTFIVSLVDNFVRPRLVGHSSQMHDLMIFVSTLGGIAVFGVIGFIIGPVLAALFMSVLEIYGLEFRQYLDSSSHTRRSLRPHAGSRKPQ